MDIEVGKEYSTRDLQKVRIYAIDGGGEFPVHGAILVGGAWKQKAWRLDGSFYSSGTSPLDIAAPPVVRYLNVYENGYVFVHNEKNQAEAAYSEHYGKSAIGVRVELR